MNNNYTKQLCTESLVFLSSNEDLNIRLRQAFSVLKNMKSNDISDGNWERYIEIKSEFDSIDNNLNSDNNSYDIILPEILSKLLYLIVDIIEGKE